MPALVLLCALLLAAGCGGAADAGGGDEVVVFAAASLTDACADLAAAFSAAHPGLAVAHNFAGSQQLAGQLSQGAPADVFVSADQRQMDAAVDAGLVAGEPAVAAGNVLEIAVEPGNPRGVTGLADLGRTDLTVVLAAEEVPAGRYARQALDRAGVRVAPASVENDVRAVLAKVGLGEADAGVVYATDVTAAGGAVEGVTLPAGQNVPAAYPIAALADAPNPEAARAYVDFVLSERGQAILSEHGFAPPP
jgi:molybdate transport system substrate-binding protein